MGTGPKLMRVRVELQIDVDLEAWQREYRDAITMHLFGSMVRLRTVDGPGWSNRA